MSRYDLRYVSRATSPDDSFAYVLRRDLSGGVNTRAYEEEIGENQATQLDNCDIVTPGQVSKRPGSVLIGNDLGSSSIVALHNYEIQGDTDQLLCYEDNDLNKSEEEGNWTQLKGDFAASQTDVGMINAKMSGISPDDIAIVQNDSDNAFAIKSDGTALDLGNTAGTGSDSPPITTVMAWYGNRVWCLKNDLLYFSASYSADYSSAFDTVSDVYRVPVGEERGIAPTRDTGMVIMGKHAIWGLAPSATPVATDQPQPLVTNYGVVSKKGWCMAGDDIFFFSTDGLRSLTRTIQDKLQAGVSYPISYTLKDSYDNISWEHIENLQMVYFDNKIIVAVPTGVATTDVWIYYPATQAMVVAKDLAIRSIAKYKVDGEERLYIGKYSDGVVHRFWYGYTDYGTTITNGSAINYEMITRAEDLGNPLAPKVGGEVEVTFESAGDYDVTVYASFDDSSWRELGTINLDVELVTFPVTFPVVFHDVNLAIGKFHLDRFGDWRKIQLKVSHNDTNDNKEISMLRYSITSYLQQYENE